MRHFRKTVEKLLGEILVERGTITRIKLQEALVVQQEKNILFGETLVQMQLATEEDVVMALSCQYGFPYLPLANYDIPPEVVNAVPINVCKQYNLIPIDKIGRSLTLAMCNPLNLEALEDVDKITGCAVQAFVCTATEINSAIKRYYEIR